MQARRPRGQVIVNNVKPKVSVTLNKAIDGMSGLPSVNRSKN